MAEQEAVNFKVVGSTPTGGAISNGKFTASNTSQGFTIDVSWLF